MIIEISVGAIALAFVILVIYLILTLRQSCKTLNKTQHLISEVQKDIKAISKPSVELVGHINDLTKDIQKKSKALDALFRPFLAIKQEHGETSHQHHDKKSSNTFDKLAEIMEYLAYGIVLFNQIKEGVKRHGKNG